MSSVVARQTLHIPMLWADASRLGAFVDFLRTLVGPEPLPDEPNLTPPLVQTPRWSVRTAQRSISAAGAWNDVEGLVPWAKARSLSVSLSGDVEFYLSTRWLETTLEITAPSSRWLDENVPLIRSKLRTLCPAWLYAAQRGFALLLFGLGFIGLALGLKENAAQAYTVLGLLLVGGLGFALPAVRLGPQPRPVWLRGLGWLAGLAAGAVLGAFVSRWMFPM